MSATSMVLTTISRNSSKHFFKCSDSKNEIPRPKTKAVMSALITSSSGGMAIVKNGSSPSDEATACAALLGSMSIGKMPVLVK